MGERRYLHGYRPEEQERLIRQAGYWRTRLIRLGLSYLPGERVLEVGCAAGATLGVLAREFPGVRVAGVDIEPRQIEFARCHLASRGVEKFDVRVGNGASLPWEPASFDHVYIMWLLEHLTESLAVLREAARVLRPGGSIVVTETDYTTFKIQPGSADYDYLEKAQYNFFARHGNPIIGRELGNLLCAAGFAEVRSAPVGFHFFRGSDPQGLDRHVTYVAEFLEPGIAMMAADLGVDEARLRRGLRHLRSVPSAPDGAMTQIVYRAHGWKPGAP